MAPTVADAGVPWVLMHRRGVSRDMYAQAVYDDVVATCGGSCANASTPPWRPVWQPTGSSSIPASASRSSRNTPLPDSGHFVPLEAPEAFASAIRAALSRG